MNFKKLITTSIVLLSLSLMLSSCTMVHSAGGLTKKIGGHFEDYGKKHDGFFADTLGLVGRIHSSAGEALQEASSQ